MEESASFNRGKAATVDDEDCYVFVYDRRSGNKPEVKIGTGGLFEFSAFRQKVCEVLNISTSDKFVLTTTNRDEIKDDDNWHQIEHMDTLYVLQNAEQELSAHVQERVTYLPHYDTIVKGGMYEYYASEGQNPLPYAFAELIDNSLAATAANKSSRKIEIKLFLDDISPQRNMIVVLDNGKGMSSLQLNNWAVYRLSKFNRRDQRGDDPSEDGDMNDSFPLRESAPRSLNSDISYFGVGGKQAIFFIGTSTRMISKPRNSKDVHELTISQEEFERREKNHEAIYSGFIRNRQPGDAGHISTEEETLRSLIEEEHEKESFTSVCVTGINPSHVGYLRSEFQQWCRQLAHIYHYYLHGPSGNTEEEGSKDPMANLLGQIDIVVTLQHNKGIPKVINLRDIHDDMQTQYIRSSVHSFEFKAVVEGTGIVEGILRYHPFLYDKETYPTDELDPRAEPDPENDQDYTASEVRPARGRRPIFECFWNGRLIPYTSIFDFEWCAVPKKTKLVPPDCYNRISGVLFTNDKFQVSTNKLTFIDLEVKLKDKQTAYSRVSGKQEKRTAIDKEFLTWLKNCHEQYDKQVKFSHFKEIITRLDLPRKLASPWSVFETIEWDGKVFKKGQLVRISRTLPIMFGSVKRFLLYGDYDSDVFATGGDIEIVQEPRCLYDEVKIYSLSKLDRLASQDVVKKHVEDEEAKLPDSLIVSWPEGFEVKEGEKRPAGKTIGDIKVEISNRKGELINKLPGSSHRKLLVELKITWHSGNGDEVMVSHISQHGKTWPYWFRKMENIKNLGAHTIQLQATLNETGVTTFAGRKLPSHKVRFTVTEADPEKFNIGLLEGPFRIGAPFQIPLEFQDEFGNPSKPLPDMKPVLEANGLELSFESVQIKGNNMLIKGITALGNVTVSSGKSFSLLIKVPGLEECGQTLKIRMLPGPPHSLKITPEDEITTENGKPVRFEVEVRDQAGNMTTQPRMQVVCKFSDSTLPAYTLDCSTSGQGILTGPPLLIKKKQGGEHNITARIDIPSCRTVPNVERSIKLLPSTRTASLKISYTPVGTKEEVALSHNQDITVTAGDVIKYINFKLLDEGGREKKIDNDAVAKLKVNWTPKLNKDSLLNGRLPDVKSPTNVADSKYCSVIYNDPGGSLEVAFNLRVKPGPPHQLKCKISGSSTVRLMEKMTSDILVSVQDQHGNEMKKVDKKSLIDLKVTGEGVDCSEMFKGLGQVSGFNIEGLKVVEGALGSREVCVQWKELKDYIRLQVVAGPPAKLSVLKWDLSQPLQVYNDNPIPYDIVCQLCDNFGNPTTEAGIRIQFAKDANLKLLPQPTSLKTNSKGQANFGTFTVSAKTGIYEMQAKAFLGRVIISGPKLKLSIQRDATKPVELKVDYEKGTYVAGQHLPEFKVTIMSEEDHPLTTAKPSSLMMKMWKAEGLNSKPPGRTTNLSPDTKKKTDEEGVFHFTKRKSPSEAGAHQVMFVYNDGKTELQSNRILVNIVAGPPSQLVPVQAPGTPTVSNTKNPSSRVLIRNLRLEVQDEFENKTGFDLEGKLEVEILAKQSNGKSKNAAELPQFVGNTRSLEIDVSKGMANLQNLTIAENSAGSDGQEYVIRCSLKSDNLPKTVSLPSFDIPFLFYNDAKKQTQMAALTKERDSLRAAIRTYKSLFETTQQLINELKMSLQESQAEEGRLKEQLRKTGIQASTINSVLNIEKVMGNLQKEKTNVNSYNRRMCSLQPAPKHPDILGKIAHLALVKDSDIARVLSWHMSADMDCVVTISTKKAKEIYAQSGGKQQVLPLDSIYKKNLPDWNKPLPHEKIRPVWHPDGNPVYARNLLMFPQHQDSCCVVFGMLLGDTIILDTLDHANAYRTEIVKYTHCPTILTRDGDRIRSNGKFGGLMNKALPLDKLRGIVFGEPLPDRYDAILSQIDLLQRYKSAMQKRESAQEEMQDQLNHQKMPEMKSKMRECQEAEEQLKDVEARLGISGSTPSGKTRMLDLSAADEPSPKKARTPKNSSVNGTPSTTPTPSRQSNRQSRLSTPASASPDEPRSKRSRRT